MINKLSTVNSMKLESCSILAAKLWAIFHGLKILDLDCQETINLLSKGCNPCHPCYCLVRGIHNIHNYQVFVIWMDIFREANQVVHKLNISRDDFH